MGTLFDIADLRAIVEGCNQEFYDVWEEQQTRALTALIGYAEHHTASPWYAKHHTASPWTRFWREGWLKPAS